MAFGQHINRIYKRFFNYAILEEIVNVPSQSLLFPGVSRQSGLEVSSSAAGVNVEAWRELELPQLARGESGLFRKGDNELVKP